MPMPIESIREAFLHMHNYATGKTKVPYVSIPADRTRDADLIVGAAIDELERARGLLSEAYRDMLHDGDGDPVSHSDVCYCTDTGAGEFVDGVLTGDTLVCLPCKLLAAISQKPDNSAAETTKTQ